MQIHPRIISNTVIESKEKQEGKKRIKLFIHKVISHHSSLIANLTVPS